MPRSLSPGGSDAIVRREFCLVEKKFVDDADAFKPPPGRETGALDLQLEWFGITRVSEAPPTGRDREER